MATTLPNSPGLRPLPLAVKELGWWALVAGASVTTAALTMRSPQLGATAALLVLAVGLHQARRPAGLTVVWLTWLLCPWLRRVLALEAPSGAADPLALAPFLVTGCIVAIELARSQLSRFATWVLAVAGAGYLVGVPAGLSAPSATAFALFAYLVAVGCFVIGYREPVHLGPLALRRVLLLATPLLSLYSLRQYIGPLPDWDAAWLSSVEDTLNTVGSPDEGHIRVFGTLNSPGTFAAVLGLAAVCYLAQRRMGPLRLAGLGIVLAALLLTYVRGAWVSVVAGMLAVVLASRGRAGWRVLLVSGLLVVALAALAGRGGGTGQSIVGRADTLGNLNSDESARARVATPQQLLPQAIASPIGHGVGSAGEASKLATTTQLRNTDNGYLSLLFQTGPFGFLLVLGAAVAAGRRAIGNLGRHENDSVDVLVVALLAFLSVGLFAGDLLYGVTGMIFWYVLGVAVGRSEDRA
jgi:O-antigen ligase